MFYDLNFQFQELHFKEIISPLMDIFITQMSNSHDAGLLLCFMNI